MRMDGFVRMAANHRKCAEVQFFQPRASVTEMLRTLFEKEYPNKQQSDV
jgi:hypothetical protein